MFSHFYAKFSRLLFLAKSFLTPRRYRLAIFLFSILIFSLSLLWSPGVFGATGTQVDTGGVLGIISSILLYGARLFLGLAIFFLKFLIEIAGYNGYLDSPAVEVGWVMVRDVTNMFFVVILLLIAFGTILGIEQYEWKKLLVKFVFAAVLVNFSRLIAGVIIDVAQVFMITFINGVAATAGGNLMQAFKVEKLMEITSHTGKITSGSLFMASVAAITFTAMMMGVMAVYLAILVFRVVALWLLIVLSPFAFVLSVIPMTQKYANEWWQKFGSNVVSGPIIAFFLWLAFVTVGAGNIHNHIAGNTAVPESARITEEMEDVGGASAAMTQGMTLGQGEQSAGITAFMTWANMANFFIAIAILIAGAQMASQLGVAGGAAMGKAIDFGKKVALVGSGVAAGLWATKGAVGGVVGGVKKGGKYAVLGLGAVPYYGLGIDDKIKRLKNVPKSMLAAYRASRLRAISPLERRWFKVKKQDGTGEQWITDAEYYGNKKKYKNRLVMDEKTGEAVVRRMVKQKTEAYTHMVNGKQYEELEDGRVMDKSGMIFKVQRDERGELLRDARGEVQLAGLSETVSREKLQEFRNSHVKFKYEEGIELEEEDKERGGPLVEASGRPIKAIEGGELMRETEKEMEIRNKSSLGARWFKRAGKGQRRVLASEKALKKSEDYFKNLQDEVSSQTGARPLSWGRFPLPSGWGKPKPIKFGEGWHWIDAEDRVLQGKIEGEKARAAAKTEDFKARGLNAVLNNARFKDGGYQRQYGLMAEQIAMHKSRAESYQARAKEIQAKANNKFLIGKGEKFLAAKIRADLNVKTLDAEHKKLESRESLRYSKETAEGMEALRKRVGAEERTKAEEAELKSFEGGIKRKFFGSEADLREQAEKEAKEQGKEGDEQWIKQRTEQLMAQAQAEGGVGVLAEQQKWAQRAQRGEAIQKQIEGEAGTRFAETAEGRKWLHEKEVGELQAGTAKSILDKIEQENVAKIFESSEKVLVDALERIKKGDKLEDVLLSITDIGAKSRFAEFSATYFKDRVSGANKNRAMDAAESLFNFERNGYEVPPSAFKAGVKKAEENLTGVERERSYAMVGGSLKRFLVALSKPGGKVSNDQEEQMMAGIRHLTKNGWSDDLLAYFVDIAKRSAEGQFQAGTREFEEGKAMEEMVLKLGWAKKNTDGTMDAENFENMSSEKRTNDFHRILGFGGQTGMLMSENAVLFHSRNTGKGFNEASIDLAQKIRAQRQQGKDLGELITDEMAESAEEKLGWDRERIIQQMEEFERSFMTGVDEATASKNFVNKIKSFNSQQEILSELKELALRTTHLDDAGHTIFDVKEGFAHGQLSDDAMDFMLSDWVKVDGATKMRNLKIHGIADMSEEGDGTASNFRADRVAATFEGVDSKQKIELLDVRNRRQIIKGGSTERVQHGAGGSYAITLDSHIASKKKKFAKLKERPEEQKAAVRQNIARDWAVMLQNAPQILLPLLGNESGVSYDDAMKGKVNVEIFEEKITTLEELLGFVNSNIRDEKRPAGDVRHINKVTLDEVKAKLTKAPKVQEDEEETAS